MDIPEIDFSLFSSIRLRSAVEAIKAQPKLTKEQLRDVEHKLAVLHARFDEVRKIQQPLEESYVRARRKADGRRYNPDKDPALTIATSETAKRLDSLLREIDPLHAVVMQSAAAREARRYLSSIMVECLNLIDTFNASLAIEEPRRVRKPSQGDSTPTIFKP